MHATVHSLTYNNFSSPNSTIDEDIAQAEAYNQTSLANELKVVKNNSITTVSWMKRDIDVIKLKINLLQNVTDEFKSDEFYQTICISKLLMLQRVLQTMDTVVSLKLSTII